MQSRTGIVEALNKSAYEVQVNLLLGVAYSLTGEILNGLTHRKSPMLQAKDLCGTSKQTKRGVLRDYAAWLNETLPGGYTPGDRMVKAMAKPAK